MAPPLLLPTDKTKSHLTHSGPSFAWEAGQGQLRLPSKDGLYAGQADVPQSKVGYRCKAFWRFFCNQNGLKYTDCT